MGRQEDRRAMTRKKANRKRGMLIFLGAKVGEGEMVLVLNWGCVFQESYFTIKTFNN